jgi:YVTN family beta-propeller protein
LEPCGPLSQTAFVLRVDPTTNRLGGPIDVGGTIDSLAVGGGWVWAVDQIDGTVARIDPHTGRVLRIPVNGGLNAIAAGASGAWVVDSFANTVTPIDGASGTVGAPIPVGGNPSGIAVGLGAVWVTDQNNGNMYRIDPTLRDVSTFRLGAHLAGVSVDKSAHALWVLVYS